MLSALIFGAALMGGSEPPVQTQETTPPPAERRATLDPSLSAGEIISEMMFRYSRAVTLTGTIVLTESFQDHSVSVRTDIQYLRPEAMLYIRQTQNLPRTRTFMVQSDGEVVLYSAPYAPFEENPNPNRAPLIETLNNSSERRVSLGEVYAIGTASLRDRSTPLDLAIGRDEDLRFLVNQWATVRLGQPRNGNYIIFGDWRQYGDADVTGWYELEVTPRFDVVRFTKGEVFGFGDGMSGEIVSNWVVNLDVGGAPDLERFRIRT